MVAGGILDWPAGLRGGHRVDGLCNMRTQRTYRRAGSSRKGEGCWGVASAA